jgi:hypothetical protein
MRQNYLHIYFSPHHEVNLQHEVSYLIHLQVFVSYFLHYCLNYTLKDLKKK